MTEVQGYLQDLLTIDCEIQTNLQNLALVKTREALENKSNEIKQALSSFKQKLEEMKEFCDIYSSNENSGFISRFSRSNEGDYFTSPTLSTSSPREILVKEFQIQKDHLSTVESRFRNNYLAAQVRLEQIERESLFDETSRSTEQKEVALKKRNINSKK